MALPFDAGNLRATGDPFPVAEHVDSDPANSKAAISVSETGVLAYFASANRESGQFNWLDRSGKSLGAVSVAGSGYAPSLSPDGNTAAVDMVDTSSNQNIWLLSLARGTSTRFTFGRGIDADPVWSSNGSQLAFRAFRNNQWTISRRAANGSGGEEVLLSSQVLKIATDWSHDGRYLIYDQPTENGRVGIWALPLAGEPKPFAYLSDGFGHNGRLSPEGSWMAYESAETGRHEVYAQSFPGKGGKFQISTDGGTFAAWRGDGKEIFFLSAAGKLMAVDVKAGEKFEAGLAKTLFEARFDTRLGYAVSQDGRRFLVHTVSEESQSTPLTVVLNWTAGLRR